MGAHKEYLNIFSALNKRGIRHCLLRDEIDTGELVKDLDLLVDEERFADAIQVLNGLGFYTKTTSHYLPHKSVLVKWVNRRFIVVDLHSKVCRGELILLKSECVLSACHDYRGYYMPDDTDLLTILVLHNILGKHVIQAKHAPIIKSLFERVGTNSLMQRAQATCPKGVPEVLVSIANDLERYQDINEKTREVEGLLWSSYLYADKGLRWREFRRRFRLFLRRWSLRTRAPLYALTGVDGVGKSSLCSELVRMLNQPGGFNTVTEYMGPWGHHRLSSSKGELFDPSWSITTQQWLEQLRAAKSKSAPSILTTLTVALKNARGQLTTQDDKLAHEAVRNSSRLYLTLRYFRSVISATRFMLMITIEMFYRYYIVYRHRRRGVTVIADRYVYDLMTGRMYDYTPAYRRVRSLLCRIFPKPTRVFLLYNEPKEILARKDDLTEPVLLRFIELYEELANRYGFDRIKTNRPASQIADQTLSKYLDEISSSVQR